MKKINETTLINLSKRLKEYIAEADPAGDPTLKVYNPGGGYTMPNAAPAAAPNVAAQAAPTGGADAGAIETIKKYVGNTQLPAYVDPKDGMIKYMDKSNEFGGPQARVMPSDWIKQYAPDLASAIDAIKAGNPQKGKFLFWDVDNGTKVDLKKLEAPAAPAAPAIDPAKVARFKELLVKAGYKDAPAPNVAGQKDNSMYSLAPNKGGLGLHESVGSLIKKIRLLEGQQLNEYLTPDENKELDRLYGELSIAGKDDPALAPMLAFYQKVPSASAAAGALDPAEQELAAQGDREAPPGERSGDIKPATVAGQKKQGTAGRKNPGTIAFQNWLNAHGAKVTVDGQYGNETRTAWQSLPDQIKHSPEGMDMLSVGTAYNVKPGQGPGTMSLGDKGYNDAMTKYGFDTKTGNSTKSTAGAPTASAPATTGAPTASTPAKPTAGAPNVSAQQDTSGGATSGVPADADKTKPYWVGGERFSYQQVAHSGGRWKKDNPGIFSSGRSSKMRQANGYSGPDEGGGTWNNKPATATAAAPTAAPVAAQAAPTGVPAGGVMSGVDASGKPVMKGSPADVSGKTNNLTPNLDLGNLRETTAFNEIERLVSLVNYR